MKRSRLFTALALVGLTAPMSAGAYMFDPDGTGSESAVDMTAFDWAPSNVLVDGGNQAVQNFIDNLQDQGDRDVTFKVWAQAQLFGTTGENISGNCTPGQSTCAGGDYEITYTFGFTERVTGVIPNFPPGSIPPLNTASFAYVDDGTSFFEMFYDTSTNSNNLTGAGFDDGTMILKSEVLPRSDATGTFTSAGNNNNEPFDDTPDGNQYPGIETLDTPPSSGSQSDILINFLLTAPLFKDDDFFLEDIGAIRFNNPSLSPKFTSVNPSALFDGLAGAGNAAITPDIGQTNGALPIGDGDGEGGPDIQLQTDTNMPIAAAQVPEPGTLLLLGLGLAGIGFRARQRG